MDTLSDREQHIRKLMEYAVPDTDLDAARDILLLYHEDRTALALLEEFYSYLPDAKEDWIKELRLVARQEGVFLLAAITASDAYLYLVSSEGIEFNGSLSEGYLDNELLDFFHFASKADFKKMAEKPENIPTYTPLQSDPEVCPACHATSGEFHELGCPVEICPWCGGQLIHCQCRFEQLEQNEIVNEQDLIRFEELLVQRGRLVYSPEQRPSFADDGPGVELA